MLIARKKRREGAKDGASDRLRRLSQMAKKAVFEEMDSSERGLSPIEVAERLEFYGINEISYDQSDPWYVFFGEGLCGSLYSNSARDCILNLLY